MEHFTESLLKRVRNTGIFESMTRQETMRVLSDPRAFLVQFHPEETVFEPENFMQCLGYVVSGRIGIRMSGYPMRTLTQGSCFGAAALFGGGERYVTEIRAQTETKMRPFDPRVRGRLHPVPERADPVPEPEDPASVRP